MKHFGAKGKKGGAKKCVIFWGNKGVRSHGERGLGFVEPARQGGRGV